MKSFIKWFDPHNLDHIKAYVHLQKNGNWPVGFVPADVKMESCWIAGICSKMADAWVECVRHKTSF